MQNFLKQKNTPEIAKNILGMRLVRERGGEAVCGVITEVEAYDGFNDKASHASGGKTKRNKVMFEEGGIWYVYLCYGVHWMLNVVTGPKDYPAAVLIRGTDVISGPGRLTGQFDIDKRFNGCSVLSQSSGLYLGRKVNSPEDDEIVAKPRIGVDYAGVWADKPYRFLINESAL